MANTVHTEFTGDAAGVTAAAAEAQGAIDSLHGKDIHVGVKVDNAGGLRDATAALERHAAASDRAAASARDHASASDRSSASARDHAAETQRATASTRSFGGGVDQLTRGLRDHAAASERAGRSVDGLGDSHRYSRREAQDMTMSLAKAGVVSKDFAKSVTGVLDVGAEATRTLGGLGAATSSLSSDMAGLSGPAGTAMSALQTVGQLGMYAAAGSGLATAAVGALGVVGVGSLAGVGVAAGAAGVGITNFTTDALKDSKKFAGTFKQMGEQAHLASQFISEPMGDALVGLGRQLVTADGHMTQTGQGIATSLRAGFAEAADIATASGPALVGAAREAAAGFARLTGEAGPGVKAFLGQLPSLTSGAVSGMSQITSEFGASSRAIEGATPSFARMLGAAGGLGAELVHIGAGSMAPFNEDMTSMLRGATSMSKQLEPAIKPSMQAFTDVANAGMGGLGDSSQGIADFARQVSAAAPGLQQDVHGILQAAGVLGGEVVRTLGNAGPAFEKYGSMMSENQGTMDQASDSSVGMLDKGMALIDHSASFVKGLNKAGIMTNPIEQANNMFDWIGSAADKVSGASGLSATPGPQQPAGPPVGPETLGAPPPGAMAGRAGLIPQSIAAPVAPLSVAPVVQDAMAATQQAIASTPLAPAVQNHVKAISDVMSAAAPVMAAGGAAMGMAMGGGMSQGSTTSMQVTDTVIRQHVQKLIDTGNEVLGIRSPSLEFWKMGHYSGLGFSGGFDDADIFNSSKVMARDAMDGTGTFAPQTFTVRRPAPSRAVVPGEGDAGGPLSGAAKQRAFGEDPSKVGTGDGMRARAVFDKQVMSWEAKPGADITQARTMDQLNSMIQSPLSGQQYTAMNAIQGKLDQPGLSANSRMFGERTEQNILRNRPGAFNVADQWRQHLQQQGDQAKKIGAAPGELPGLPGMPGMVGDISHQRDQAKLLGAAIPQGVGQGIRNNAAAAVDPLGSVSTQQKKRFTDDWIISSPSRVGAGYGGDIMAGIGLGVTGNVGALTGAMGTASDAAMGIASNAALPVGYVYGQGFVDGVNKVIKQADFQGGGTPKIDSEQARTALGQARLLGPAGSGAAVYKAPAVTFSASAQQQVTRTMQPIVINLEGQLFKQMIVEANDELLEEIYQAAG